jgi:hypothetical protein
LFFANENHFPGVIRVVGGNVGDFRRDLSKRLNVGLGDEFFEIRQDSIEVCGRCRPGLGVEGVKGLVVVAIEAGDFLAFELRQGAPIPEEKMIGKLANGMIALAVGPGRLLRRETGNGYAHGNKPFFLIVGRPECVQKGAAKVRRGLGSRSEERSGQYAECQECFTHFTVLLKPESPASRPLSHNFRDRTFVFWIA